MDFWTLDMSSNSHGDTANSENGAVPAGQASRTEVLIYQETRRQATVIKRLSNGDGLYPILLLLYKRKNWLAYLLFPDFSCCDCEHKLMRNNRHIDLFHRDDHNGHYFRSCGAPETVGLGDRINLAIKQKTLYVHCVHKPTNLLLKKEINVQLMFTK